MYALSPSMAYQKTVEIVCHDGDKPFRAWKKRHGKAVRKFNAVPTRGGDGWLVNVWIPQDSAVPTQTLAEFLALVRDYCYPEYLAPTAEYVRQREARDARRAAGYDLAADPLTVAAARR